MRSLLFTPGDAPDKMQKAVASGADAVILDLEDSVALANKEQARKETSGFLKSVPRKGGPQLIVRINALNAADHLAERDLEAVMPQAPDAILLPKAESGADVQWLGAKLATLEAQLKIEVGATRIMALVTETPSALFNLASFKEASPRLSALTWGCEDLLTAVGGKQNRLADQTYTPPFQLARNLALFAAAGAGVAAIDGIYPNFRDSEGTKREALEASRDGFTGKLAIHPSQVPIFNEAFTPSTQDVDKAQEIIAAFKKAGSDTGTIGLNGRMLDRPHLTRAEQIVARAKSAGILR